LAALPITGNYLPTNNNLSDSFLRYR